MDFVPSSSSRRYAYRRGIAFTSGRLDRPYPSAVPALLPSVTQAVPPSLVTAEVDVRSKLFNSPDQGTAEP